MKIAYVRRAAAAILLAVVVSACATQDFRYHGVPAGAAGADLVFTKGYNSTIAVTAGATWSLSTPPVCEGKQIGWLSFTGNTLRTRAPAGGPIAVSVFGAYAWTSSITSYSITQAQTRCSNMASFTPVDGHRYTISQVYPHPQATCRITVVDTTTGAAPPDLRTDKDAVCMIDRGGGSEGVVPGQPTSAEPQGSPS